MRLLGNLRGDTIVEVLVAITVVGVVLAGAYLTINRNIRSIRGAQERAEALQLLQGQLESLRTTLASAQAQSGAFCLNGTPPGAVGGFTSAVPASPAADSFNEYPAACKINAAQPIYHVSVVKGNHDSASNTDTYILRTRWQAIDFLGKDEVQLEYKI